MTDPKCELLSRINLKCDRLDDLSRSYRSLERMASKEGSTQEFVALVDAIGTVTLSNLSDSGNILKAILKESAE